MCGCVAKTKTSLMVEKKIGNASVASSRTNFQRLADTTSSQQQTLLKASTTSQ